MSVSVKPTSASIFAHISEFVFFYKRPPNPYQFGQFDAVTNRVARFFLMQHAKTWKLFQMTTNYTKCP
jgi:hypothetical protein